MLLPEVPKRPLFIPSLGMTVKIHPHTTVSIVQNTSYTQKVKYLEQKTLQINHPISYIQEENLTVKILSVVCGPNFNQLQSCYNHNNIKVNTEEPMKLRGFSSHEA